MHMLTIASGAAAPATTNRPHATALADMVVASLIDEATLTPKPGLVDLRGRGAHRDLDWLLMCHAAWALHPAFCAMAASGAAGMDTATLREAIGATGRQAEAAMMLATGGVNTHRGAIWALGLLVTAAAESATSMTAAGIAERAGEIARHDDRYLPAVTGYKGEAARRRYGVGGARAQAQAGFPHVTGIALPCLHASRQRGDDENTARLNALLAVIAELDDTCILSRGGSAALAAAQSGAARVLAEGGAAAPRGRQALRRLEADMLARNVSPGGAADLLTATLFLDRLAPSA